MNRLLHHIGSSDDEDVFLFESPIRYNPNEKAPFLSPKTPPIEKYFQKTQDQPLRYKLQRINPISATPQPRRNKSSEWDNENNSQLLQTSSTLTSFTPTKKTDNSDLNDFTPKTIKQLTRSASTSVYSLTPTTKKNPKRFKTIRSDGSNIIHVIDEVRAEFNKVKSAEFRGDVVLIIKGITKQALLEITKKAVSQIVVEFGYTPSSSSNLSSTVYCELNTEENNTPQTPVSGKEQSVHFDENSATPVNGNRTYITLSAISDENAQTVIKGQLMSGFKGIVSFSPVRGRYNSALMSQYPEKVIEICKSFGFAAKLTEPGLQTVECDMSRKMVNEENVSTNSNNLNKKRPPIPAIPAKSSEQSFSTPKKSSFDLQESNEIKITPDSHNDTPALKVEVPWNSEKDAENMIRSTLKSDFVGTIKFVPSIGLYSVISMKNYPDKIIEICSEFKFQAFRKSGQIIECTKTGELPKIMAKEVAIPSGSKKCAEQLIRATMESGFIGNLNFTSVNSFGERIQEIASEYKFESQQIGQIVRVIMTERKSKEIIVDLPLENAKALKHKLQKYLECGFIGPIIFRPKRCEPERPVITQFAHIICDICKIYSCPAKILDSTGAVIAQLCPKLVDLYNVPNEDLENNVRNHLSQFTTGFVVFSVNPDSEDTKKNADTIVRLCKEEGFPTKQADFYAGRVVCNLNKAGYKKQQDSNSSHSADKNCKDLLTLGLPTNDLKAAEQLIRRQLSSKFKGTIIFVPKSSLYNQISMANFPQRIVDICSEYGYLASIINPHCQIVECKMMAHY